MPHRYRAYGLTVESELELPELRPLGRDAPAAGRPVRVRLGRVAHLASGDHGSKVLDEQRYLLWNQLGCLLVQGGEEIVVEPGDAPPELLRMMVLGRAFGAIFHQRDELVLHASAVAREGRALLFCGRSGAGKSTLAAEHHAAGDAVLGDDVAPVARAGAGFEVAAGFARVKLAPAEAARVGLAGPRTSLHPEIPGRFYAAERGGLGDRWPIRRIYVLAREEPLAVEPLSARDGCVELLRYTFAADLLCSQQAQVRHLEACADLAEQVGVRRLGTGDALAGLAEVRRLIDADLAG